jgi:TRAP-type mannitol/chloroaromatic compound transport system permease small subunit
MQALLAASRVIDAINRWIGRHVSWLILVAVVISAGNAVIRKIFDTSSNAWLELQWQLFGAVFMLAAAYTLLVNEHVRIDVINANLSKRTRDWIDLLGHALFLMPLCLLLLYDGVPFFWQSFVGNEQSSNAGGLVVWPSKLLLPLGFFLLALQGISEIVKRIAIMRGLIADPLDREHHAVAADEHGV